MSAVKMVAVIVCAILVFFNAIAASTAFRVSEHRANDIPEFQPDAYVISSENCLLPKKMLCVCPPHYYLVKMEETGTSGNILNFHCGLLKEVGVTNEVVEVTWDLPSPIRCPPNHLISGFNGGYGEVTVICTKLPQQNAIATCRQEELTKPFVDKTVACTVEGEFMTGFVTVGNFTDIEIGTTCCSVGVE